MHHGSSGVVSDGGDEEGYGFYKAESVRILDINWMWWRTVTLRDHYRLSWKEIAEALNRHVDTVKNYYKVGTAELVYEDVIHFYLTEKTRQVLQKLGVDTMAFSGTELAAEAARSYFANKPLKGIGPARAKEILDAIEDLYDSRANR